MNFSDPSNSIDLKEISIRAFRAIDDLESCMKFRTGHLGVLEAFGFELSSSKEDWMSDPNTYVVIIESRDGSKTYGGSRIQLFGGSLKLPIESAIGDEVPELDEFLKSRQGQIAELCGLWNSVAVAGLGIGSTYSIRSAIALAKLLGFNQMVALCSAFTYRISHRYGFNLVKELAEGGKIYYPGANQYAHITYQNDLEMLPGTDQGEFERILEIYNNPKLETEAKLGDNLVRIIYNLQI